MSQLLWTLPAAPALAAPVLLRLGRPGGRGSRRALATTATGVMLVTLALAGLAVAGSWTGTLRWSELLVLRLELTPLAALVAVTVPAVAAPILCYAAVRESDEDGLGRLLALLSLFVGAMELLVVAADLLTLLVAWELVGACSWALVAHHWRRPGTVGDANVAFLTTRAGDLGLFLAVAAAFAGVGGFGYDALIGLEGVPLHLVTAGVVMAAAAKSAQLPFAPWLFNAMSGPTSVSALLHAATMVAAGAYLLVRLHPVLDLAAWFGPVVVALGLATALAGGVVAVVQPHAKKLLAGSTSAHYGLMFVAVGAGHPLVAALHLVAHAFFKAPLFLAAGIAGSCSGGYRLVDMRRGRVLPMVAVASGVCALALAGVPPLGGAWTKEQVVAAAGHHAAWAALLVGLAGALSAAYAARFQLLAFGGDGREECGEPPPRPAVVATVVLAAVTVALSLLWWPAAGERLSGLLGGELPASKAWELSLSVALVAAGLYAGRVLARRRPTLGETGLGASVAGWLRLPALGRVGVVRPVLAAGRTLAAFDDRVLDLPPRLAARTGRGLAGLLTTGDRGVVDAGVRATAAVGTWLAGVGVRLGETTFDGAVEGLSRLVGAGGEDTRRLQTGLSHHYYTLIAAGLVVVLVVLLFWR